MPAVSAPSQGGGWASPVVRSEARAQGRLIAQGEVVRDRRAGEDRPAADRKRDPDRAAEDEAGAPEGGLAEQPAGDPEPGEDARRDQGQQPRIRRLERREQRLRAPREQLVEDLADRRDEEQPGTEAEPDDPREGAVTARDRRPEHGGQGDHHRQRRSRTDEPVDRPAGAIAEDHVQRAEEPEGREGGCHQAELERPYSHGRSLAGAVRSPGARTAAPPEVPAAAGLSDHRKVPPTRRMFSHRATPPDVTDADFPWASTTERARDRGTWPSIGAPAVPGPRDVRPGSWTRGRRTRRAPRAGLARSPPHRRQSG